MQYYQLLRFWVQMTKKRWFWIQSELETLFVWICTWSLKDSLSVSSSLSFSSIWIGDKALLCECQQPSYCKEALWWGLQQQSCRPLQQPINRVSFWIHYEFGLNIESGTVLWRILDKHECSQDNYKKFPLWISNLTLFGNYFLSLHKIEWSRAKPIRIM